MCGIVGIVSKEKCVKSLIQGLKKLAYRGYDSAGLATLIQGEISKRVALGKINNLEELIKSSPIDGNIGIAHWAGGSIRALIDEMVAFYGKGEIEGWFGQKISYIKKHVKGCTQSKKRIGKYHKDYPQNATEGVLYQRCKDVAKLHSS